tara:strand:+ start:922 stop:1269 length:348 start_codon:yes stop_codon:yes gene_type:complete
MHEQRIQRLGDLLLVRKLQGTLEWDPNAFEVHRTDFNHMSTLLTHQHAVSSASCYSGHIEQLGAVDHVIIFAASHADTSNIDLKIEAAFVLPNSCSNSRYYSWRNHLTCAVEGGR